MVPVSSRIRKFRQARIEGNRARSDWSHRYPHNLSQIYALLSASQITLASNQGDLPIPLWKRFGCRSLRQIAYFPRFPRDSATSAVASRPSISETITGYVWSALTIPGVRCAAGSTSESPTSWRRLPSRQTGSTRSRCSWGDVASGSTEVPCPGDAQHRWGETGDFSLVQLRWKNSTGDGVGHPPEEHSGTRSSAQLHFRAVRRQACVRG